MMSEFGLRSSAQPRTSAAVLKNVYQAEENFILEVLEQALSVF